MIFFISRTYFVILVRQVHREFLRAGADVIQAFTFSMDDEVIDEKVSLTPILILFNKFMNTLGFPRKSTYLEKISCYDLRSMSVSEKRRTFPSPNSALVN